MVYIYHLFDTGISQPIYVGASKDINRRFKHHLCTTIKDYIGKENVVIEVVYAVKENVANKMERELYNDYVRKGIKLLNASTLFYRTPYDDKYDNLQIGALAGAFKKSFLTIRRWILKKDDRLTSERAKLALFKIKKINNTLP